MSVHLNVWQYVFSICTVTVSGINNYSLFFNAFEPVAMDSKVLSVMIFEGNVLRTIYDRWGSLATTQHSSLA